MLYQNHCKTPKSLLQHSYRAPTALLRCSYRTPTLLLQHSYRMPAKRLQHSCRMLISKMIEYLSFLLQCISVTQLGVTSCYLYFQRKSSLKWLKRVLMTYFQRYPMIQDRWQSLWTNQSSGCIQWELVLH